MKHTRRYIGAIALEIKPKHELWNFAFTFVIVKHTNCKQEFYTSYTKRMECTYAQGSAVIFP